MLKTILDLLQDEDLAPHVQGHYTRIVVNLGPYFEVLGAVRQGGPYMIRLYDGSFEDQACAAFVENENKESK